MFVFFKAQAERGVAWTLIDNGKLANQIVRLAANLVKKKMIGYYRGGCNQKPEI